MYPNTCIAILFAPPLVSGMTSGQLCRGTASESDDGNWYCSEVNTITYRNISQSGSYNRTTSVDPDTGICGHRPVSYSGFGALTPLFGELSMHLRGPMNVSQIAVYNFYASISGQHERILYASDRRNAEAAAQAKLMLRRREENRAVSSTTLQTRVAGSRTSDPSATPVVHAAAAEWGRVAYYTSTAPAEATGLAFLANLGDPRLSGTFDYSFGNSLGYVSGTGGKCVSESTPFDGTLETSEFEIAVFTDKPCSGNCNYARPDATAHRGWEGESKAFFIEFQMDHYDNYGTDQGMLSDAPAWWFLNADIPRILQYGNDRNNIPCSCWSTGCGEFDAFEVLGRGEERAKSTIHRQGNLEGGDSNYFKRPVGRTLKFAVIFHNLNITASVLDDNFEFGRTLDQDQIADIIAYEPKSNTHSLFGIGT
ncbi:hypothetical protein P154DRAFT_605306 [Amniculicola lignicola CBS 123094]|uniref:glucan endo-1,3-beta-D-glucosidase n=1 Tax=Amniculicola lignicola CBS 123094 TaxID=1392246 RepID=A0A6A5W9S0_9PLEO|nr:hypothetical protein P154DRAFT_605306 [Amniculicola lignicola CBS 123094]